MAPRKTRFTPRNRPLRVVNTVDSRLAGAALDAVRQWRQQPSRLNVEGI